LPTVVILKAITCSSILAAFIDEAIHSHLRRPGKPNARPLRIITGRMSRAGMAVLKPVSARLEKARVFMYNPLEAPRAAPVITARIGNNGSDRFIAVFAPCSRMHQYLISAARCAILTVYHSMHQEKQYFPLVALSLIMLPASLELFALMFHNHHIFSFKEVICPKQTHSPRYQNGLHRFKQNLPRSMRN